MFSREVLDHFQNPRNAGELLRADVRAEVSNPVCGDVLRLSVTLEHDRIREVRFLCRGCTASIACASMLTETIRGKKVTELDSLTPEWLANVIGGLPEASFHAAQLACDALRALVREMAK